MRQHRNLALRWQRCNHLSQGAAFWPSRPLLTRQPKISTRDSVPTDYYILCTILITGSRRQADNRSAEEIHQLRAFSSRGISNSQRSPAFPSAVVQRHWQPATWRPLIKSSVALCFRGQILQSANPVPPPTTRHDRFQSRRITWDFFIRFHDAGAASHIIVSAKTRRKSIPP